MTYSQKYCLVQLLRPLEIGAEFTSNDWPLHVTIAGVFALEWSEQRFEALENVVKTHEVFSSRTTTIERFGPQQEVRVRLVKPLQILQAFHIDIATFIVKRGGVFNDPQYQFAGFRPHITMYGTQPEENFHISFDELALVDMFPDDDHTRRKIIKLFRLDNAPSES